jgi:hypothetical protein
MIPTPDIWGEVFRRTLKFCFRRATFTGLTNCTYRVEENNTVMLEVVLVIKNKRPPLWSSGQSFWLQIQRSRVRFPALSCFLSSSGSGTGSTQPREPCEVNWGTGQHTQTGSNSSTIAAGSSNVVTNARCSRYSCMRSWWWMEVPPETCRAVSRYK